MPIKSLLRPATTQGERFRQIAYAAVAVSGALLALAVTLRLGHKADTPFTLSTYHLWVTLAGLAGGFVGLRVTEHFFGHPGAWGVLRALGGIIIICLTAPVITGSLALPLYGTMFGPFMFGTTLVALPLLGIIWAVTLLAVHLCLAPWRRERDSLFTAPRRVTPGRAMPPPIPPPPFTPRRGSSGSP
jgi:hypothetical protein